MRNTLAIILAGGRGERLGELSKRRAKPAVPFGGRYRLIDFTLSNCVNSGIFNVAVLTQYRPRSLATHIGTGRPWDLNRSYGGVEVLQPHLGYDDSDWYKGTADACFQNKIYIASRPFEYILVLGGDHVYAMDYNLLQRVMEVKNADVVVATLQVPRADATRFGTLELAADGRIVGFEEKAPMPKSDMASMGIYLFRREAFFHVMGLVPAGKYDFGAHIIPALIASHRCYCYIFDDYWRDVGTIDAYYDANMDLVADLPEFNLYDADWPVRTVTRDHPPARFYPGGSPRRSLVAEGCVVQGDVSDSLLFPGVVVETGAVVEASIIMDGCRIGRDARLHRAIIDKETAVGDGCVLGYGDDYTPNVVYGDKLSSGLVVVGRESVVPPGVTMGRNACAEVGVRADDFPAPDIPAGGYVAARPQ